MDVNCKYKITGDMDNGSTFFCQIRLPFEVALSDDDKKEIISSLYKHQNVPERYSQMHKTISDLNLPLNRCFARNMCLVTRIKENLYSVAIDIRFASELQFKQFVQERNLIAEKI